MDAPVSLERDLVSVVGRGHVLTDRELLASYESDWTGRFRGRARLVVRPADTAEVAAVLRACAAAGVPVVPQGGNTGLVGGSVPHAGEVVLSLTRLAALGEVDAAAAQVTAGAGVTIAAVQERALMAGFEYPVDLASRGTATVGGTIATNAGGMRVHRFGSTRARVAGIEAVLANGDVVARMGGLLKDNTGYDLAGLLAGSEGTLGVITRAVLRLSPALPARATALFAFRDMAAAVEAAAALRDRLECLDAIEAFFEDGLALVCAHTGASRPFAGRAGCYLLAECAAREDPSIELATAAAALAGVEENAFASDGARRRALWRYREAHTEAIGAVGVPHKLDVTLPAGQLVRFEREVRALVAETVPGARAILFGHMGDGNLHVNILGPAAGDERADDAVLRLVASLGGSISAEHGIGVAKRRWLHLVRGEADIAAMLAIKRALDPAWLLNPGVIFPPGAGTAPAGA